MQMIIYKSYRVYNTYFYEGKSFLKPFFKKPTIEFWISSHFQERANFDNVVTTLNEVNSLNIDIP